MPTVIVIPADTPAAYVRPMLDLLTGEIVELANPDQLELDLQEAEQ